jgi:hypothetical protein
MGLAACVRNQLLVLACVCLAACSADPQEVSIAQLARQQRDYDGRLVLTVGVLRSHDSPRHYWIADAKDRRVELLTPGDLSPHIGRRLTVEGRFRYAPDRGRRIEVSSYTAKQSP